MSFVALKCSSVLQGCVVKAGAVKLSLKASYSQLCTHTCTPDKPKGIPDPYFTIPRREPQTDHNIATLSDGDLLCIITKQVYVFK